LYRKQRDNDVNLLELHKEILSFCDDISPQRSEKVMRDEVVQRFRTFVQKRWSEAEVKVFGSFNTGLYLPTSDIDIVILGNCALYSLERELQSASMIAPGSLNVLRRASVPIIKFEDRETKVKVDISFNTSGLVSAEKVKAYLKQYPLLDKMILVVKHYLYQCKLNEVYFGGIGSYSVILLIVSFFQHCSKCDLDEGNLGILLTNFFELYGTKFDYSRKGIGLDGQGSYFDKMCDNTLLIKDPADPTNTIKATWNIFNVKRAFERAFNSLSLALNNRGQQSPILSLVVSIPDDVKRYRKWVEEHWGDSLPSHGHQSHRPSSIVPNFVATFHGGTLDKIYNSKMSRICYNPPYFKS